MDARTAPTDATPRGNVDEREWARRHLSIALAAEAIDEKDFHVSLALQLLVESADETAETEASNALGRRAETGTASPD